MTGKAQRRAKSDFPIQWQGGERDERAQILSGLQGALIDYSHFVVLARQDFIDTLRKPAVSDVAHQHVLWPASVVRHQGANR